MKSITGHPLIVVTEEDVKISRSLCGVEKPERIKESLDAIDEWCQKQDHLVEAYKNLGEFLSAYLEPDTHVISPSKTSEMYSQWSPSLKFFLSSHVKITFSCQKSKFQITSVKNSFSVSLSK